MSARPGALPPRVMKRLMEAILARSSVHKLTHKIPAEAVLPDVFYRQIFTN